jgi:hypothetical protein
MIFLTVLSFNSFGQKSISISIPFISSTVTQTNNWSPPTAGNRKDYFNGTAIAYGVNLSYSFRPVNIIKTEGIYLVVGAGYLNQRFNIERPFNYDSQFQPIFYTDYYAYRCLKSLLGISYQYEFKRRFTLTSDLTYNWLYSFQQAYKPTVINSFYGWDTQVNKNKINFGNILLLSAGLHRDVGNRISIGINLILPLKTLWRNDTIFNDDPSKFSSPDFTIGASLNLRYRLSY